MEDESALVGNNLRAHLDATEKERRDDEAVLDFEMAANLRDEIKRLQEIELVVADDPLTLNKGIEVTKAAGAGAAKRGKAGGRATHSSAKNASLPKKPELDELIVGQTEKVVGSGDMTTRYPLPRSTNGKPGQCGGFKASKRGR